MDVSVIIVTRNTCSMTCEAIRSVLAAREGTTREIIVVDNGSSDGTPAALRREFPSLQLLSFPENLGFARACNLAAKQAAGEFLLLLNSDARLEPDALGRAVGWMRAHPDCAVAGAQLLNADGSFQNSIANFPTLATELLNKSLLRRLFPRRFPGKEQRFSGPLDVETVLGAFMLIRTKVWDAFGGLDERFFFFFEETDFCLRVRRSGGRVVHLPDVRVWHGQGGTARQFSAGARIEYWRSRYAYFAKHGGGVTRAALEAGLLIRLLADWIIVALLLLLTFGRSAQQREKGRVLSALWAWQLRGRPAGAGLPRGAEA